MKDVAAKNLATEKVAVEAAIETRSEKDTKVQDEESDKAEEALHRNVHAEKSYEKIQESNTARAEKADLPAGNSNENNDIENISKSTQNMSETTSGNQQLKNWLVCNYCDQSFANEGLLRDHTENDHGSRRIRYRIIYPGNKYCKNHEISKT